MDLIGQAHRISKPDGNSNDINTDYIISGRYKFRIENRTELGKHIFEDIDPNFVSRIQPGDFIVAGKNFGCGSSREQAPQAILAAGIKAVLAESFSRIFYRNAFNNGLPLLECDTSLIQDNDELTINLSTGVIINQRENRQLTFKPLPAVMLTLLSDGGLVQHFKKYGGFNL